MQEHQRYHEVLVAEENKRKALLDIVYSLEVGRWWVGGNRPLCMYWRAVGGWLDGWVGGWMGCLAIEGAGRKGGGAAAGARGHQLSSHPCPSPVSLLQNEKRQLETAIVVEGTQAAAFNRSMSSELLLGAQRGTPCAAWLHRAL